MENQKKILKINPKFLYGILAFILISIIALFIFNKQIIVIELNGDDITKVEYGDKYIEKGAKAYRTGSIFAFLKKELDVQINNNIELNKLGTYTVNYVADDNGIKGDKKRTVIIEDTKAPTITLKTSEDAYTLPNHKYEEEGFTCKDLFDGDLTDKVKVEEKDGIVTYSVTDSNGNTARVTREIVYDDRKGPEIYLEGGSDINWSKGVTYEDYYSANDDLDGDVTNKVKVEGKVDVNTIGDYVLTYTCKDSYNNETKVQRTVHVTEKGNKGIIYLTFDDGPWQYTDRLIGILDQYNVKATFFVTGAYPDYHYCINKAYNSGHAIGVHTWSHRYEELYANDEAFWQDFEMIQNAIEKQIGHRVNIMRFPGGSSNTVSASYSNGIMSRLVNQVTEKGYVYFDWNVSSGDAGNTTDPNTIYANIVNGISGKDYAVVLCHDIKPYTIDSIERVIKWGLNNGYTFAPLTTSSPTCHHGVNN